jgi:hypothetical protein
VEGDGGDTDLGVDEAGAVGVRQRASSVIEGG